MLRFSERGGTPAAKVVKVASFLWTNKAGPVNGEASKAFTPEGCYC